MNPQDYFIWWSIYYVAAFVLLLASIFFTNFLWRFLKEPIVLIVAILLFYPVLIDQTYDQYAPAIAVMAMDFLWGIGNHAVSIANELTYKIEIALAVYFAFIVCIRWPVEYFFKKWWYKRKLKQLEKLVLQANAENEQLALNHKW